MDLTGGGESAARMSMNSNQPFENDKRLRALLREWKVDCALPPRFQENVWHRIALGQAKAGAWQNFTIWLDATFRRPALAISFVAVLLFIGLTTGFRQGQDKTAQAQSHWRALYVQSVDPYQEHRDIEK